MAEYHVYHADAPMSAEKMNRVLEIMEEAFPPNERRVREGQRALFHHPLYRVCTAEEDGRVLAFMALWTLGETTFFEHFASDPEIRGRGIGGEMLDWLLKEYAPCVLEVELPSDGITRRRIAFYRRHGICLNERDYDQLPLRPGDARTPMYLMSYPHPLDNDAFIGARRVIYRHVYGAEEA